MQEHCWLSPPKLELQRRSLETGHVLFCNYLKPERQQQNIVECSAAEIPAASRVTAARGRHEPRLRAKEFVTCGKL